MGEDRSLLQFRSIPSLKASDLTLIDEPSWRMESNARFYRRSRSRDSGGVFAKFASISVAEWRNRRKFETNACGDGGFGGFASVTMAEKVERKEEEFAPTSAQLLKHPLALIACVPKDAAIFAAGAVAGAAAKTVTAPLDRIKLLMQTHGVRLGQQSAKKAIGFIEAITMIAREEGIKGYGKATFLK